MSQKIISTESWSRSLSLLLQTEFATRYQGTHLGWGWAVVKPLSLLLLLHLIAHHQVLRSAGVPYSLFALVAWVPWQMFSEGFSKAASAIRSKKQEFREPDLHKKAVPASLAFAGAGDFLVGLVVAAVAVMVFGIQLTPAVLALPFFILQLAITTLGVSYFFAAWHAQLPDVPHVIQLISRAWLMLTPVFYPLHFIDPKRFWFFCLNPMVGVVEGFRWCLLGSAVPDWSGLAISATVSLLLFVAGALYFHRLQRRVLEEVYQPKGGH